MDDLGECLEAVFDTIEANIPTSRLVACFSLGFRLLSKRQTDVNIHIKRHKSRRCIKGSPHDLSMECKSDKDGENGKLVR